VRIFGTLIWSVPVGRTSLRDPVGRRTRRAGELDVLVHHPQRRDEVAAGAVGGGQSTSLDLDLALVPLEPVGRLAGGGPVEVDRHEVAEVGVLTALAVGLRLGADLDALLGADRPQLAGGLGDALGALLVLLGLLEVGPDLLDPLVVLHQGLTGLGVGRLLGVTEVALLGACLLQGLVDLAGQRAPLLQQLLELLAQEVAHGVLLGTDGVMWSTGGGSRWWPVKRWAPACAPARQATGGMVRSRASASYSDNGCR
jgi:hypothetical protein